MARQILTKENIKSRPRDYYTKGSKLDKYHMMSHMQNLKMIHMNLFTKQKQTQRTKFQRKGWREGLIGSMGLTCTLYI